MSRWIFAAVFVAHWAVASEPPPDLVEPPSDSSIPSPFPRAAKAAGKKAPPDSHAPNEVAPKVEKKAPVKVAAPKAEEEDELDVPVARLPKGEVKSLLTKTSSKITIARGRCKPYVGKLSARDTDNGCTEAFEIAEEIYNSLPPEVKITPDFQKLIPRFEELVTMKDERLRRADEWAEQVAANKGASGNVEEMKEMFPFSSTEWDALQSQRCEGNEKDFISLVSRARKMRESASLAKFCKGMSLQARKPQQRLFCEIWKSKDDLELGVWAACVKRDVSDWGFRRLSQDLRNLERGSFLLEERARKNVESVEAAVAEKLKPWMDVAAELKLTVDVGSALDRVKEKQQAFAEAFKKASERECVAAEEFQAMDSRSADAARVLGKVGAKVQKSFLAKEVKFSQNANREVTGRYQAAKAVYSRAGDKHCWVASATYYAQHFGSDKWSPWSTTYDGGWLTPEGKLASVMPCRCR